MGRYRFEKMCILIAMYAMKSLKCASVLLITAYFLVVPGNGISDRCSNPVPGLQKMLRGVDITKLDLTPSKPGSDGFKSPVVKLACGDGNTWRGGQGEDEYQLPDQVWQITPLPGGWLSEETGIYKSYNEIREKMTQGVGGEGLIWQFAFSASHSFTTMQNTIVNNSKYISEVSSFESATSVEFDPSWGLEMDSFAKIFIDRKISGTFEKNQSAYLTFINQFGTHYFSSANFGGIIREVLETRKDYFSSKTDSDIEKNAKASFLSIISLHGGQVSSSTKIDETFSSATTYFAHYFGGDRNLLVQDGIQKWLPTIDKDPWLFSGKLTPIGELIENEEKRSSMEKAVDNYVLRSYLNELDRLITTAKAKSDDSAITALQQRVSDLKNRTLLDINEVYNLGKTVEGIFLVPDWFTSNTKLCFKWWATGNNEQCGGGAEELLCAKPNFMTPLYLDDTDDRAGGCEMQWGIQSTGFPSWFSDVKVCYQWSADGRDGQCSGSATILCAGINEFSPPYLDDSNNRGGGCRMYWKIEVPESSPLWLKTAKICYSWYPDGDSTQCGASPNRNLCAAANQWTENYLDDTDNRRGGCKMSWGLKLLF